MAYSITKSESVPESVSESVEHYIMEQQKQSVDQENIVKKKSILVTRGRELSLGNMQKRGSSKATIQWKEGVKERSGEEPSFRRRSSEPGLGLLVTRGSRWNYIHDVMIKLRSEEARLAKESDEEIHVTPQKGINLLVRDLGSGIVQKRPDKGVELILDQEVKLQLLKNHLKAENDSYLKQHPELDILLTLVYTKLYQHQPDDPKLFVANYVHYLNTHREELVLQEVDVPFDRPPPPRTDTVEGASSVEEERQAIAIFSRKLVEMCANIASHGTAYVNMKSILDSIIKTVTPSEEDISSDVSLRSTEVVVSEILMSLLTSVARARTRSTELVVEDILASVLENIHPSIKKDSEDYLEVRESIERFVETLLKIVTEKTATQIQSREKILEKPEHEIQAEHYVKKDLSDTLQKQKLSTVQTLSKPILKKFSKMTMPTFSKDPSIITDEEVEIPVTKPPESRVKFRSIPPK